jgi:hypothetical protein
MINFESELIIRNNLIFYSTQNDTKYVYNTHNIGISPKL